MKILVDMNLAPRWVQFLTASGFDAVHWSGLEPGDATDQELMQWALETGRHILISDLDFGAILASSQGRRPSVIELRSDQLAPEIIGSVVISALRKTQAELEAGAIVSVDAARARVRILPLSD